MSNTDTDTDLILYEKKAQHILKVSGSTTDLPKEVQSSSILCFRDSKDGIRKFLPFTYGPAESSTVRLGKMAKVTKGKSTYEGQILYYDNYGVTLSQDSGSALRINKFDTVEVDMSLGGNFPWVEIDDAACKESSDPYYVSFTTSHQRWYCSYSAIMIGEKIDMIMANANITNTGEEPITPKSLTVVAGVTGESKKRYRDECFRPKAAMMLSLASTTELSGPLSGPKSAPCSPLTEYERFDVPSGVIPRGQSIRHLFTVGDIAAGQNKVYYYDLDGQVLSWGIQFKAPRYMPSGVMSVYNEKNMFVGCSDIPNTTVGRTIDLLIGQPTGLTVSCSASTSIEKDKDTGKKTTRTEYRLRIDNKTQTVGTLRFHKNVGDKVYTSVPFPDEGREGVIAWEIELIGQDEDFSIDLCEEVRE